MGKRTKRSIGLVLVFIGLILTCTGACIPLGLPSAVNVIVKADDLELSEKNVVLPDFYLPEHGAGLGGPFADILQAILLERSVFKSVSRDLPVVWTHPGETLESRYAGLTRTASQRGYDYVLIGVADQIFYGGLEDTTLSITLRLFDSRSGVNMFMATHKLVSKAKDPSYPMDTKLSSSADSPRLLVERMLRQIVARMR